MKVRIVSELRFLEHGYLTGANLINTDVLGFFHRAYLDIN